MCLIIGGAQSSYHHPTRPDCDTPLDVALSEGHVSADRIENSLYGKFGILDHLRSPLDVALSEGNVPADRIENSLAIWTTFIIHFTTFSHLRSPLDVALSEGHVPADRIENSL